MTKLGKRFLSILTIFLFALAVVGCEFGQTNPQRAAAKKDVADFLATNFGETIGDRAIEPVKSNIGIATDEDGIVSEYDLENNCYSEFKLGAVSASYESSNPEIMDAQWTSTKTRALVKDDAGTVVGIEMSETKDLVFIVNRPEEDTEVQITITASAPYEIKGVTYTYTSKRTITFTVAAKEAVEAKEMTIAEINEYAQNNWTTFQQKGINDETGEKLSVVTTGVVTEVLWGDGYDHHSFVISDGDDSFYVYAPSSSSDAVEIGDLVQVTCVPTYYYSIIETAQGPTVKVLYGGQEVPAAKPYTVDSFCAAFPNGSDYHNSPGQRLALTGVLDYSSAKGCYVLKSAETGTEMAIYYKSYTAYEESLIKACLGMPVVLTTAIYDYHSSGYWRLLPNVYDYPIQTLEMTDADKVAAAKSQLAGASFAKKYTNGAAITIPQANVEGVTVTWEQTPAGFIVEGKVVAETEKTVKLTATITCGAITDTFVLEFTIAPEKPVQPTGNDGKTIETAYTVEEVIALMENFNAAGEIGTELVYVRGIVNSQTAKSQYGSYTLWLAGPDGSDAFELYSVVFDESITEDYSAEGATVGAEVVCYGYLQLYVKGESKTYEMPYLSAAKSPSGVAYNPPIVKVTMPHDGKTIETAYTVEEAIAVMENFNAAGEIGTELVYVRGIVNSQTAKSQYGSYTLWLAGPDGSDAFELYSVVFDESITEDYSAEGATVGAEVVCYGYLQLYVKGESKTYEMPYLSAAKSPSGAAYNPPIVQVIMPEPKNDGKTIETAYTVEEVIALMENFNAAGEIGTELVYVRGIVNSQTAKSQYGSYTLWLAGPDGSDAFELYSVVFDESITEDYSAEGATVGAEVVCYGYLQLYVKGESKTYEMPYLSAAKSPSGAAYNPPIVKVTMPQGGNTGDDDPEDVPTEMTIAEVLASTENITKAFKVSGMVCEIKSAYSEAFNNITVYITDGTNELQVYRMVGGAGLVVGDYITVTGTYTTSYGGEIEQGCTYELVAPYMTVSAVLASQSNITTPFVVSGVIESIVSAYSEQFNNISFYIQNEEGAKLQVYRMIGGANLAVGDTVYVKGTYTTSYGGEIEANCVLLKRVSAPVVTEGKTLEITFPGTNPTSVNDYISTWTSTAEGHTLTFVNINNYNGTWSELRAGKKNTTGTASIAIDKIDFAVSVFTFEVSQVTASELVSAKLYVYSNASMTEQVEVVTFAGTVAKGNWTFEIVNPTANCYYKLVFELNVGGSNGTLRFKGMTFAE